jgi:hypothetical protein
MVKNTKRQDWARYEEEKAEIADAGLTADQYECAVRDLAKRMNI